MKTIEYNVKLNQDATGDWFAGCEDPLLPGFYGKGRQGVLWNVYKVIFEDLREANDKNPFLDSLELRVNIIET
jgi:hypothetical protein